MFGKFHVWQLGHKQKREMPKNRSLCIRTKMKTSSSSSYHHHQHHHPNMLQFWMNWWKKLPSLLLVVQFSLQVSARQLAHFLEIGLSVFLDMLKQPNRAPVDYYLTCPKHIVMPLWAHFGLVLAIIGPFLALKKSVLLLEVGKVRGGGMAPP